MMKTFLKWLILTPIALLIVTFAIVNRQVVPVVLDPFGSDAADLRIQAPLFFVMFACGMVGVVAGGLATWFAQGRHRRALRDAQADVAHLRAEADRMRNMALLPAPGTRAP
jgi:uncharacterized integral membrane protein